MTNITKISTINIYVTVACVLQLLNYNCPQHKLMHTVFCVCINLCDVSENFSNTRKQTISLLTEHQFQSNSKLRVQEIMWKNSEDKTCEKNMFEDIIIQLEVPCNSYRCGSHENDLHANRQGFSYLLQYSLCLIIQRNKIFCI